MTEPSQRPTVASMLEASRRAWTAPSPATFGRLVGRAGVRVRFVDAARFVALSAFVAGLFAIPRGAGASLGTFLSGVLGFAAFTWFLHRLTLASSGSAGPTAARADLSYVLALVWAPVVTSTSLLVTIVTSVGLGPQLAPLVGVASVTAGLALSFQVVRAVVRGPVIAIVILLVVSAGAAYGVLRVIWMVAGAA